MLKLDKPPKFSTKIGPDGLNLLARSLHYGWIVMAIGAVMWTISSSMRFAVAVLVPDLQDPNGLGWSYWSIAFAFSLQWLLAGLAGPVLSLIHI